MKRYIQYFGQGILVRQRIHLSHGPYQAAEKIPESSGLRERCVFTIAPVLNLQYSLCSSSCLGGSRMKG